MNSDFVNRVLRDRIAATRFLGVGNPSESGTHLLYYLRQETGLPKANFINTYDIFNVNSSRSGPEKIKIADPSIERYIFIDDLCGSGTQAIQYSSRVVDEIKRINPNVKVDYIPLFSTTEGLVNVKENTTFDLVESVFSLNETFKIFSNKSRYFKAAPKQISKEFARSVFEKYGQMLCPGHPLGYKDGQQILGFEHNIPDNTLPAIWFESESANWVPVFKRYSKVG